MSVNLVALLDSDSPSYIATTVAKLDTTDERTRAVKRALAHYHEASIGTAELTRYSRLRGTLNIDWGHRHKRIHPYMLNFCLIAFSRCTIHRRTFSKAVMYLFDRMGRSIRQYREYFSDETINEMLRQLICDLASYYQEGRITAAEKISMSV